MLLLGLTLAMSAASPPTRSIHVPVDYETVSPSDYVVPVGDSVLAATWDALVVKPTEPVKMQMACLMVAHSGVPVNCVPASQIPTGQKTVDWAIVGNPNATPDPTVSEQERNKIAVAASRLRSTRIASVDDQGMFTIRLFEVTLSPTDERAPFTSAGENALNSESVEFAVPLDPKLLSDLYPPAAMLWGAPVRVNMLCNIKQDLGLLCRDTGKLEYTRVYSNRDEARMIEDVRLATYQLASTMRLKPKDMNGQDVAGRDYEFSVFWQLPR